MAWDTTTKDEKHGPKSLMDKEVTIKLNPRKALKFGLCFIVLLGVFFLGRCTAGESSSGSSLEAAAPVVESSESSFSFAGFFSGLFEEDGSDTEKPASTQGTNSNGSTTEGTGTTTAATTADSDAASGTAADTDDSDTDSATADAAATTSATDEEIVTTYTKVDLAMGSVKFIWKGTWGKVTDVEYTLTNGEAGTIEADHFLLLVEGYDDFEKKIPIPLSKQKIKANTKLTTLAKVPNGFAYNAVSAGELSAVTVTLILVDPTGKTIDQVVKDVSLQG